MLDSARLISQKYEIVKDFTSDIVSQGDIHSVLLVGSLVWNLQTFNSDIDVVIVFDRLETDYTFGNIEYRGYVINVEKFKLSHFKKYFGDKRKAGYKRFRESGRISNCQILFNKNSEIDEVIELCSKTKLSSFLLKKELKKIERFLSLLEHSSSQHLLTTIFHTQYLCLILVRLSLNNTVYKFQNPKWAYRLIVMSGNDGLLTILKKTFFGENEPNNFHIFENFKNPINNIVQSVKRKFQYEIDDDQEFNYFAQIFADALSLQEAGLTEDAMLTIFFSFTLIYNWLNSKKQNSGEILLFDIFCANFRLFPQQESYWINLRESLKEQFSIQKSLLN